MARWAGLWLVAALCAAPAAHAQGGGDAKPPKPAQPDAGAPAGKQPKSGAAAPAGKKPSAEKPGGDKPSEAKPAGEKPADKPGSSESDEGESLESEAAEDTAPAPVESSEPHAPPPPPPRAEAQEPHPFLAEPEPPRPERKLEVGPEFGVGYRPAQGSGVTYGPGFAWGIHARIEAEPWLGARVYFTNTRHPVSRAPSVAGVPVDQPDLSVTLLAARLEPTWVIDRRFRAFVGLGAGWARIVADPATSEGTPSVATSQRSGVGLELSAALGAIADIVPDWLAASVMVSGAAVTNQSGAVFDETQAFDRNGQAATLEGLPHVAASLSAMASLGLVL